MIAWAQACGNAHVWCSDMLRHPHSRARQRWLAGPLVVARCPSTCRGPPLQEQAPRPRPAVYAFEAWRGDRVDDQAPDRTSWARCHVVFVVWCMEAHRPWRRRSRTQGSEEPTMATRTRANQLLRRRKPDERSSAQIRAAGALVRANFRLSGCSRPATSDSNGRRSTEREPPGRHMQAHASQATLCRTGSCDDARRRPWPIRVKVGVESMMRSRQARPMSVRVGHIRGADAQKAPESRHCQDVRAIRKGVLP